MSELISLVAIGFFGVAAIYFIRELKLSPPVQYQNDPNAIKGLRLFQISAAIIFIILTVINLWLYLRGA